MDVCIIFIIKIQFMLNQKEQKKYNCESDEIFINFRKLRNFLKSFVNENMKYDFLPIDLNYCLSADENIIESIKIHLVSENSKF